MQHRSPRWLAAAFALAVVVAVAAPAAAGPREQARRMHDRLVGVPPDEATLAEMANLIGDDEALAAADLAMDHRAFYSVALKNFVSPWTNVARTVYAPLNDYTATVIGMIRDDVPFDTVLSADLVYTGAPGVVSEDYSHGDNRHYELLESGRVDLSDDTLLVGVPQSTLPGSILTSADVAGVTTTRAAGEAYFSAGTNRRMWRFISMNYLCRDLEEMKDTTRPVERIRQDVSRSPGGDSELFLNHCSGCHSGMDPMAQAFAYFNWDDALERVVFTRGAVQPKYFINDTVFRFGHVTPDDRWDNYWREGPNAALEWRGANSGGYGPQSLGLEVTASRAFSICQAEKVFSQVCFRPVSDTDDADEIERIADVFEANDYSLKRVFAETAVYCMGQ
jgi:hypothetical protein